MVPDSGLEVVVSYGFQCPPCGVQVVDNAANVLWDFSTLVRLGQAVAEDVDGDVAADVIVAEFDIDAPALRDRQRRLLVVDVPARRASVRVWLGALALADIDGDGSLDVALALPITTSTS